MKYKDALRQSMELISNKCNSLFLGYNVKFGSHAYGTLNDIDKTKIIETPLAENLMIGLAMGLSLEGYRPVVFFERHDFMLIALDGIVNHMDKIEQLSHGQFKMPVIIRAVVGSKSPIDPGIQHIQDFSDIFKRLVKFKIYEPKTPSEVIKAYEEIVKINEPCMVIEQKDLYDVDDRILL